ncbi:hypothetical protein ACLOJK_028791 [Asimina triloba]
MGCRRCERKKPSFPCRNVEGNFEQGKTIALLRPIRRSTSANRRSLSGPWLIPSEEMPVRLRRRPLCTRRPPSPSAPRHRRVMRNLRFVDSIFSFPISPSLPLFLSPNLFRRRRASSSFSLHAMEKESQFEINREKAKEALQKLDEQILGCKCDICILSKDIAK